MNNKHSSSRDPNYFTNLYARNSDPWDFKTSTYERRKYKQTLKMLAGKHYPHILEVGCSIGILTKLLSQHCDALLGIDVVDSVLASAAKRCAGLGHVTFKNLQVPRDWPRTQNFDLIIFSEVLYFLIPEDIIKVSRLACENVAPGGAILLVNYTKEIDEPCSGNEAAEIFIQSAAASFVHVQHLRQKNYRIDMLSLPITDSLTPPTKHNSAN